MLIAALVAVAFNALTLPGGGQTCKMEPQSVGITPEDMPHDYLNKKSGGQQPGSNGIVKCENVIGTQGLQPTTLLDRSRCKEDINRSRFSLPRGTENGSNGSGAESGSNNSHRETVETAAKKKPYDIELEPADIQEKTWPEYYTRLRALLPSQTISGWVNTPPLMMRSSTASTTNITSNIPGINQNSNADNNEIKVYDESGTERKPYSVVYNNEKQMLEDGACQLVAMKSGGKYNVTPLMDGTYKVNKGANGASLPVDKERPQRDKKPRAPAMNVVTEQILYPQDPFWPRSEKDWKNRQSPSYWWAQQAGEATGGGGVTIKVSTSGVNTDSIKYSYTHVCGHKTFPLNWYGGPRREAWRGNKFGYYKIPVKR